MGISGKLYIIVELRSLYFFHQKCNETRSIDVRDFIAFDTFSKLSAAFMSYWLLPNRHTTRSLVVTTNYMYM